MCCDLSNKCIHINCNERNNLDYEYLKLNKSASYCKICTTEM